MREARRSSITSLGLLQPIALSVLLVCLTGNLVQAETVYRDPNGEFSFALPPGFIPMPEEARNPDFICMYHIPDEDGAVRFVIGVQWLGGTIERGPLTGEGLTRISRMNTTVCV